MLGIAQRRLFLEQFLQMPPPLHMAAEESAEVVNQLVLTKTGTCKDPLRVAAAESAEVVKLLALMITGRNMALLVEAEDVEESTKLSALNKEYFQ
jgi:hypothetical protein